MRKCASFFSRPPDIHRRILHFYLIFSKQLAQLVLFVVSLSVACFCYPVNTRLVNPPNFLNTCPSINFAHRCFSSAYTQLPRHPLSLAYEQVFSYTQSYLVVDRENTGIISRCSRDHLFHKALCTLLIKHTFLWRESPIII